LGEPFKSNVEIVSLHSVSKGFMGECGFRGGYMEMHNIASYVQDQVRKIKSLEFCANTIGQISVALMTDPPTIEGGESSYVV